VIALEAQNAWPIFQLDVKSTFIHGDLTQQLFIDQPPYGYMKLSSENKEMVENCSLFIYMLTILYSPEMIVP